MLTDAKFCANDVERANIPFFNKSKSIYHKSSLVDKNLLLHLTDYTQCRSMMLKPGISRFSYVQKFETTSSGYDPG